MNIIGILGVIFGAAGFAVAVYSQYKQRKFEEQFERKEELRDMAETLKDIIEIGQNIRKSYYDFTTHDDLVGQIRMVARGALAVHHSTDSNPTVALDEVRIRVDGQDVAINSAEDALEARKDAGNIIHKSMYLPGAEDDMKYVLADHLRHVGAVYRSIDNIQESHPELIEQFDSSLLDEFEHTFDNLLLGSYGQIIQKKDGVVFNPEEFDSTAALEEELFQEFYWYDGIEDDLDNLSQLIERAEDIRKSAVQTSYS